MEFQRKQHGPRPKVGELLRNIPEEEEPLEIDLQRVVNIVESYHLTGPYRTDYEFLVGLIGDQTLERLRPTHRAEANEKFNSMFNGRNKTSAELLAITSESKLFDPISFGGRRWYDDHMRSGIQTELLLMTVQRSESWLTALKLLVLFPDEKKQIINELKPNVDSRLAYIEGTLEKDPQAVLWEDLAAITILFPELRERIQVITRAFWPVWQEQVEGSLGRAQEADTDDRRKAFATGALGISIGMHILAAEKAEINTQGALEITPARKKIGTQHQLPIRPGV